MTEFWIVAGFMGLIALAFLAWPIWRYHELHGQWSFAGMLTAALILPASVWIYLQVTTWSGQEQGSPHANAEQVAIVEQLAQKMQENPDDVEGWMLLGRSYLTLQDFPAARQAFLQAWQRTPSPGTALKLGLGMAMIHSDRASLGSDGGQLIEEVLQAEPDNQQALWYGGLVALERGRQDLARQRWSALLGMNPPAEVAQVIQQQIAMLGAAPGTPSFGAGNATRDSGPGTATTPPAATAPGTSVKLRIALGDDVSTDSLGPDAALFIFARSSGGGPPLAVIRRPASALPGEFTLTDADTMIQGNSLGNFAELTLVARLSATGQPIEQSGDLYAEARYDREQEPDTVVELVINKVVP